MERSGDKAEEIIEASDFLKELRPYLTVVEVSSRFHNVSSTMVRRAVSAIRERRQYIEHVVPEEIVRDLEVEEQ